MKQALILSTLLLSSFAVSGAHADQVKYLNHGADAFAGFTTLIEGAHKSIDMVTFIFEPCHSSAQVVLESLARASKRGVKVRLLLDAMGHSPKEQDQFVNSLGHQGIEVRFYNANYLTTIGLNLRVHEKLTVIDGERYIAGGRNISDEYFGMSTIQNWIDSDVVVSGRSTAQAAASFQNIWDGELTAAKAAQPGAEKPWTEYCGAKLNPVQVARARAFAATKASSAMDAVPARDCANVEFVSDQSDFGNPKYSESQGSGENMQPDDYMSPMRLARKGTASGMIDFLSGARSSLRVTNYFYAPVGKELEAFASARDRHVMIDVITNQDMDDGPEFFQEAEEYVIQSALDRDSVGTERVSKVSSKGALKDLNELSPPGAHFLLHTKSMIRDGKDALVGSYNLDSRSYNTNLESYVIVHDCPALAADVAVQANWVRGVRDADTDSRSIPEPKEPSAAAKLFADMNMIWF